MAKPFHELRERLLRAGVTPRHVRRYLTELADHLADLRAEEERAGRSRADAESAALVRLGGMDDLAKAMIEQRQFQSWCVRAPWAMFGLAPLCLLAGAYFVACVYLWFGWKIFLPGADTPFGSPTGPMYGVANIYFQAGKLYYFGAPVLVGWGIGLIADSRTGAWDGIRVRAPFRVKLRHYRTCALRFHGSVRQSVAESEETQCRSASSLSYFA